MLVKLMVALVAGTFAFASLAQAEEQTIEWDQVPKKVRQAAEKAAEGNKLTQAAWEEEGGQKVYELSGKTGEDRNIEIDVDEQGNVLEVEHEIAMNEIPTEVEQTLNRFLRGFRGEFVEKSVRPAKGNQVWYEFEGKDADGQMIDVEIREDGGKIKIELEDDADTRAATK